MALTCGLCAGSNYYNQPLIYTMAKTLGTTVEQSAITIVISQFAYALGLIILIPLSDKYSKSKLIISLMFMSGLAQIGISFSYSLWSLYFFSLIAGFFSVAAQILIPFIASLGSPKQMAHTLSSLMAGLLLGVLLARTYAGVIATFADWHSVYFSSGILFFISAIILYFKLPTSESNKSLNLFDIYRSMLKISITSPQLMRRSLAGSMGFASVITVLSTTTLILTDSPYNFNELQIGLFGLVGIVGVLATKFTGRLISNNKENLVAKICCFVFIFQWLFLYFAQQSFTFYIIGAILGYFVFSSFNVLNQSLILRESVESRFRMHSLYMFIYFLGASVGSTAGIYSWHYWGWNGCIIVGLLFSLIAIILDRYDSMNKE